jgi:hypothetical protein
MFRKTREFAGLWRNCGLRSSSLSFKGGPFHKQASGLPGFCAMQQCAERGEDASKLVLDQRRQGGRRLDRSRIHFEVLTMVVVFGLMALTVVGLGAILSAWKTGLVE